MPELEEEMEKEEEQTQEEEESKFPVWIIPLVAGPVLLIVLIVVLAGTQTSDTDKPPPEMFNQPKLMKEAVELQSKATKYYYDAQQLREQKKRNELFDKALEVSEESLKVVEKIRIYYEEHDIQKTTGGVWDWEKLEQELCQLRVDIIRDRGF